MVEPQIKNPAQLLWRRNRHKVHSGCHLKRKNPEQALLARPQQVVIKIIDDTIRGQNIKPEHSVTLGNPQGTVLRLWTTMYSLWGLHPTAILNYYHVLTASPYLSPKIYMPRHLEGHKMSAAWYLPISVIDSTAGKIFHD